MKHLVVLLTNPKLVGVVRDFLAYLSDRIAVNLGIRVDSWMK